MRRGNDSGTARTEGILHAPSFVSRLPSEILSNIFSALGTDLQPKHLIPATRVCHRWRNVALADPRLWTQIPCDSGLKYMNAFFHRSQSLPLRLTLRGQEILLPDVRRFLLQHLARIEKLDFSKIPYIPRDSDFASPAPLLTHFRASCAGPYDRSGLPANLFKGNAPVLREIELYSITPHWLTASFPSLQTLKLVWPQEGHWFGTRPRLQSRNPTFIELSSLLSGSPFLTHLTLINCLELLSQDSSPYARIDLPKLTRLHIEGSGRNCSKLLDLISLPADCHLEIGLPRYCPQGQQGLKLLSHIRSHFSRYHESDPDCSYSGIISLEGSSLFVSLQLLRNGDEDHSQRLRFPLETTQEKLRLDFPCDYSVERRVWCDSLEAWLPIMLLEIFDNFPLHRIRTLWFNFQCAGVMFSQEAAYGLLAPCHQLEHLKISLVDGRIRRNLSETCEYSPIPPGEAIPHSDSQPFLPNLSSLEINSVGQEVHFRPRQDSSEQSRSFIFYDALFSGSRPRPVDTLILSELRQKDISWPIPDGEPEEILRISHPGAIISMETSELTFVRGPLNEM